VVVTTGWVEVVDGEAGWVAGGRGGAVGVVVVVVLVAGGGGGVITGAARWAAHAPLIVASAMISDVAAFRPGVRSTRP
jgi:hypothetical protein